MIVNCFFSYIFYADLVMKVQKLSVDDFVWMDDGFAGVGQYDHQYRRVYSQMIPIRRELTIKWTNDGRIAWVSWPLHGTIIIFPLMGFYWYIWMWPHFEFMSNITFLMFAIYIWSNLSCRSFIWLILEL